jgi:hypothetical protein
MERSSQCPMRDEGSVFLIPEASKPWQRVAGAAIAELVVSMIVNGLFHVFVGWAFATLGYFSGPQRARRNCA